MTSSGSTVNNGGAKPKPKPKHITTACLNCRKKKIKCDGVAPRCSHCVLYSHECIFQSTVDKRKIAWKDRLIALDAHTQQLEALLKASGIAVPVYHREASSSQDRREVDASNDSGAERGDTSLSAPTQPTDVTENLEGIKPNTKKDTMESPEKTDPFEDQLCGRMGSLQIAEDGQLRFYGATSNLNILHNNPLTPRTSGSQCVDKTWQDLLNSAGVGQSVSSELEDHLLKLYFCWEDPSIHVVDEELYFRARASSRHGDRSSGMYSEVLTNAM